MMFLTSTYLGCSFLLPVQVKGGVWVYFELTFDKIISDGKTLCVYTILLKYIQLYRVEAKHKEEILMHGCYLEVVFNVEVVFNFVAKARHHTNLAPVLFSVLILFLFQNVFCYSYQYYVYSVHYYATQHNRVT